MPTGGMPFRTSLEKAREEPPFLTKVIDWTPDNSWNYLSTGTSAILKNKKIPRTQGVGNALKTSCATTGTVLATALEARAAATTTKENNNNNNNNNSKCLSLSLINYVLHTIK